MAKRDFYETLGVSRGASDAELKSAFRKAAMQCHPDRNPGDKASELRFKEVNEAYQTLSDAQKRAAYDRFGHAAFDGGGGAGFGMGEGFASSMADIFDDLFGDVMGRRGRSSGRERGSDLRYNMEITLEEAFSGKAASLKVPTSITCEACLGSGAKPGSKPKTCPTCGGQGRVRAQQGFFAIERTCPTCQGRGEIGVHTLDGGESKVKIPEGTQSGKQFKVRNKGMPVLRARDFGDLYIQANVETPQNLTRRQRELLQEFDAESSTRTQPEASGFIARMKEFFENLGNV